MHSAKRRRADDAASILSKPFRTPLRVDPANHVSGPNAKLDSRPQASSPNALAEHSKTHATTSTSLPVAQMESPLESSLNANHNTSSILTVKSPSYLSHLTYNNSSDNEVILIAQRNKLQSQLREVSAHLETVSQAQKIALTRKDDEITRLITQWQTVSRDAAETLLVTARGSIAHMGGLRVWQKSLIRSCDERFSDHELGLDMCEMTAEQKAELDFAREEAHAETIKYGLSQQPASPCDNQEGEDDTVYTMGMMLRQLNIDLEIIGYDEQTQAWKE